MLFVAHMRLFDTAQPRKAMRLAIRRSFPHANLSSPLAMNGLIHNVNASQITRASFDGGHRLSFNSQSSLTF